MLYLQYGSICHKKAFWGEKRDTKHIEQLFVQKQVSSFLI